MKLVFICGTFEPGRDGVGDYTRRLAAELIKQGNKIGVIALNDKFIADETKYTDSVENIDIPVLRLSVKQPMDVRLLQAQQWIDIFNPDWLSLQFVPFSFDEKGLIFGLANKLVKLAAGRRWHIMFHETWVGMESGASVKMKLWGFLQKKLTGNLIKNLKPLSIHTHTSLYKSELQKFGVKVKILPLFGNLPIRNAKTKSKRTDNTLKFLIFGGIHYGAPIAQFADKVSILNETLQYNIQFLFVGNNGSELKLWSTTLMEKGFAIHISGFLPEAEITSAFLDADIGITTTPELLVEKSGTVAAMNEYGLPVVCVARDWNVKGFASNSLLTKSLENSLTLALKNERILKTEELSERAQIFIKEIESYG